MRLIPVVDGLIEGKAAAWADREYFGRPQRKLISLRRADLSLFSAREVDLVHHVIQELWELNGSEVSDLSHRFAGWLAAADREVFPYATVAVDEPRPLNEEEVAWAHEEYEAFRATEFAATP